MPESWRGLRQLPDRVCGLLEAAELGGFAAATFLLDSWGMAWLPGKAAAPWPAPPPAVPRWTSSATQDFGRSPLRHGIGISSSFF